MRAEEDILEPGQAEDTARYLVHSRNEIAQVLRAIMRNKGMVTGYFNEGQSFILSILLDVNVEQGYLVLDCGPDPETNARALECKRIVFVTNQNHIRIQFRATALEPIEFQGHPAFRAPLPTSLLRLQRRKYFRLAAPVLAPLYCIVPDLAGGRVTTRVTDISIGGVAISGFPDGITLQEGFLLPNCRISLPEEGTVVSSLEIRNLRKVTKPAGHSETQAGCAFTGIPGQYQAVIQRYITRTDLERRAKNRYR